MNSIEGVKLVNQIVIGIIGSLSAIGLGNVLRWLIILITSKIKLHPFNPIWKNFRRGNTIIVLSGRYQGHTVKVSFSENESAMKIQKLLSTPFLKRKVKLYAANHPPIPLDKANIIAIGDEHYNEVTREILHSVLGSFSYSYTKDGDLILNNNVYRSEYRKGILVRDYALICKTDNPFSERHKAIVFAGNHGLGTLASVLASTTQSNAKEIISKVGNSNFYAVIESNFDKRFASIPSQISVVLCGFLTQGTTNTIKPIAQLREKLLESYIQELGVNDSYLKHVKEVSRLSLDIARALETRGLEIDMEAIYFGAMFHDIGRTVTQGIRHGVEGRKLVEKHRDKLIKEFGLRPDTFDKIFEAIECHIVGGISIDWIRENNLKLPEQNFLPKSIEAKLVGLCDQILHEWDSHKDVFREAPNKVPKVFERLYYQCKCIINKLFPP